MNTEDLNKAICQLISDVELLKQDNKTANKRLDVINENVHQACIKVVRLQNFQNKFEEIASLIDDTIGDNKIFDSFEDSGFISIATKESEDK